MRNLLLLCCCSLLYLPAATAANHPATDGTVQQQVASAKQLEKIETDVIRFQKSTPRVQETLEALKQAKASYIQELTASPGNVSKFRTTKAQRQMVGVYLFDLSYASVFDRKKQSKEAVEAVQQLLKTLGFNDRNVNRQYQKLVKESGTATLKTLITSYQKVLNDSFRDIATTTEGAALITEAAYGWLIEGLYVTSEIVAQQDYAPLMLYRINEHAECIKPVVDMLETVRSNPNLSKTIASSERLSVLTAISSTLKSTERISRTEVDAVRVIITKARSGILN